MAFAGAHIGRTPRPPQAYASLLEHAQHPRYLRDGLDRSIEFERLAPLVLAGSSDDGGLLATEHEALERGDVPRFTAISGTRDEGPLADLLRRVEELDPDPAEDLCTLTSLLTDAADTL